MKKMPRLKKAGCLGLALLLMVLAMGCGNKGETEKTAPADGSGEGQEASEEQITITAMLPYTQKKAADYAIERMKEIMPEVNLVMEVMPEDGNVTVKTRIAAGTLPDIWKSDTTTTYLALESDNVLELDKYVEETGILERTNPGERDVFWAKDGHCYAVPYFSQESYLIFITKKFLRKIM